MEKLSLKELSARGLIDIARTCMAKGDCFNCALFDEDSCTNALILALASKLEEMLGANSADNGIEWIPFKAAKPTEDDEYLVMVAGAEKPTALWYDSDEETFYEETDVSGELEIVFYPVTHWAMLPVGPAAGASPRPTSKNTPKRCATCAHEDRMAECDRCIACEKHNLWEERK